MINVTMSKVRELADKVTNVVMSYTEVEAKVREATNDDPWGPTGAVMQEISQFTFTYEHFPEAIGMLWKRMLTDSRKNWRRVYKSLRLLDYLIHNGSERVIGATRERLYELRQLENYTFTDEYGRDQGINVRQKVKEILNLVQNDDLLREERKKSKKNKDKYVGIVGGGGGYGSRYCDDYDASGVSSFDKKRLDDIKDWQSGNKTIAEEAIDKVKEFVSSIRIFDNPDDFGSNDLYDDDGLHGDRNGDFRDGDYNSRCDFREKDDADTKPKYSYKKPNSDLVQSGARVKQTKSTTNQPATSACADANGDFADFKTFDDAGDDFNPRALEAAKVSLPPIKTKSETSTPAKVQSVSIPTSNIPAQSQSNADLLGGLDFGMTLTSTPSTNQNSSLLDDSLFASNNGISAQQMFQQATLFQQPMIQQQLPMFQQQPPQQQHHFQQPVMPSVQSSALDFQEDLFSPPVASATLQPILQPNSGTLLTPVQNSTPAKQQAPASQVDLRLGSTWLGAGVDISLDNLGGKQQKAAALTIKQLQQQQNKGVSGANASNPVQPGLFPGQYGGSVGQGMMAGPAFGMNSPSTFQQHKPSAGSLL